MQEIRLILFYDGQCNLCHRTVRFVANKDRKQIFYFAPLQGETALKKLDNYVQNLDTVVLWEDDKVYVKSKAVFRVLRKLGFPWSIGCILGFFPTRWTDVLYEMIASSRYRIWGRRNQCDLIPANHSFRYLH